MRKSPGSTASSSLLTTSPLISSIWNVWLNMHTIPTMQYQFILVMRKVVTRCASRFLRLIPHRPLYERDLVDQEQQCCIIQGWNENQDLFSVKQKAFFLASKDRRYPLVWCNRGIWWRSSSNRAMGSNANLLTPPRSIAVTPK